MCVGDLGLASKRAANILKELMMSKYKQVVLGCLLATSTMLMGGATFAQVALAPGAASGAGTLSLSDPNLDGSWIAALNGTSGVGFSAVDGTHSFSGTFEEYVYDNDVLNPYGLGKLTFVYLFYIAAEQPTGAEVNRLSVNGFGDFQTTVGYATGYSKFSAPQYTDTAAFNGMDRSADGDTLGASWAGVPGVGAGTWGQMLVYTDATSYYWNTAKLQDGAQASVQIYAPVPEPEIYAMLAAGLGFMGFVARRRKQVAA